MDRKTFTLDKILTCTARDYVESEGKRLEDYEMRGVHFEGGFNLTESKLNLYEHFANEVPLGTEAVVNYSCNVVCTTSVFTKIYSAVAQGTALIPRKKNN
ncbi:MAG: hypothetical protein Q7S27_06415 [Nanoarchaeota archaeon]|nr:hypothetical protein [Nanoarchaeota archaeon]